MPCVLLYHDFICSTHATSCWSDLCHLFLWDGKDWPKINFLQIWDKLPEWKQTFLCELVNTLPSSSLKADIVLYPHTSEGTVLSICSLLLQSPHYAYQVKRWLALQCAPLPHSNLYWELTDWYMLVFSISNVFFPQEATQDLSLWNVSNHIPRPKEGFGIPSHLHSNCCSVCFGACVCATFIGLSDKTSKKQFVIHLKTHSTWLTSLYVSAQC